MVIDDTGSVKGIYAFINADLDRCHGCLTHSQTLKDRATQLLRVEWSSRNAIQCTCKVVRLAHSMSESPISQCLSVILSNCVCNMMKTLLESEQ